MVGSNPFEGFFKNNLACPLLGPPIPLFSACGDESSGFESRSGQPYSNFAEAYVKNIP